jgi:hypothetical protein
MDTPPRVGRLYVTVRARHGRWPLERVTVVRLWIEGIPHETWLAVDDQGRAAQLRALRTGVGRERRT